VAPPVTLGMARSRVVVIWLVLAALLAVIAAIEYGDVVAERTRRAERDPRLLLPLPVDQLGAIEIADAGTLHRFERAAAGGWFYHGAHTGREGDHTHAVDPDASRRIEQALLALGRARIERQLPREGDGRAYGLAAPRVVVLAYRPGDRQPLVQYAVGDVAPDGVSRYVDIVGGPGMVTIPGYQVDNLLALVEAVKAR
jgi:hypothetical protein